jgi:hypothetical protein
MKKPKCSPLVVRVYPSCGRRSAEPVMGDVFADFDGEHRDVWLTDYGNGYEVVAASFHDADVATKFFDRWWAQMNAEALRDQGMLASASATRKRKA